MYESFADVYDSFMSEIPYEEWADKLCGIFSEHGIDDGIVLDLGCGTGRLSRLMAGCFDMIGVDLSPEMLMAAREAAAEDNTGASDILYLCQDMRELDLYGTIRAAYSMCDSMNYILSYDDLALVLSRVALFMEHGGVFAFDMRTEYFYREGLSDRVFYDSGEDADLVWENYFDEETGLHEYDLTIYKLGPDARYEKYEESHTQRAFSLDEIKRAVKESGLDLECVLDEETWEEPVGSTRRLLFVTVYNGDR